MLEVLIAALVLAIGVLACSAAIMRSTQSLVDNLHRQRAVRLASNLAELLRGVSLTTAITATVSKQPPAVADDCWTTICDSSQLVQTNLHRWHQQLRQELPSGQSNIYVDRDSGIPHAKITVTWRASGDRISQHSVTAPLAQ